MGLSGKNSNGPRKAPRRDTRPRSTARGITELSVPYFDLVNGGGYWSDPEDPERREAWELWREKVLDRWKRPGWRPSGWVAFDLPPLLDRVRPWRKDMLERWNDPADAGRQIQLDEFVYGLRSTSDDERAEIEETWRKWIALVDGEPGVDIEDGAPAWFIEAQRKVGA